LEDVRHFQERERERFKLLEFGVNQVNSTTVIHQVRTSMWGTFNLCGSFLRSMDSYIENMLSFTSTPLHPFMA